MDCLCFALVWFGLIDGALGAKEWKLGFACTVRARYGPVLASSELELELIQSHMAQKPMLRGEVGARALRVRSDVRGHGQVPERVFKA